MGTGRPVHAGSCMTRLLWLIGYLIEIRRADEPVLWVGS